MATTKVTITVEPDEQRRLIAAVDCYIDWTVEQIADRENGSATRRKAQDELPKLRSLKDAL